MSRFAQFAVDLSSRLAEDSRARHEITITEKAVATEPAAAEKKQPLTIVWTINTTTSPITFSTERIEYPRLTPNS